MTTATTTQCKTEMRAITPQVAKDMLRKNAHNRNLSESHVTFLAKQMQNGTWKFDGQPIRFSTGGQLLDGQHRLSAVIKSETTQTFLVITGIDSEAFKVMDTGKNRNAGDIFAIEGIANYTTVSATTRNIWAVEKGFGVSRGMTADIKPSNSDLLAYYLAHPDIQAFVKAAQKFYIEFEKVLALSDIAAFMYLMGQKNVTQSEDFWRKVCVGTSLEKDEIARVLRQKLIRDKLNKLRIGKREKTAIIFKAWNMYRKGETVKYLKWGADEKFPKLI